MIFSLYKEKLSIPLFLPAILEKLHNYNYMYACNSLFNYSKPSNNIHFDPKNLPLYVNPHCSSPLFISGWSKWFQKPPYLNTYCTIKDPRNLRTKPHYLNPYFTLFESFFYKNICYLRTYLIKPHYLNLFSYKNRPTLIESTLFESTLFEGLL